MSRILKVYQSFVIKFPISSEAIKTGLLMGVGDVIAQTFVEKTPLTKIDIVRTGQFTIVGTVFVGPPLRFWYGGLEKFFGNQGKIVALKKVAADQFIFSPIFLGVIMSALGLVQGDSIKEIIQRLKDDYPSVLINNYKFWPAAQLIVFYMVPLKHQVVTVQCVAIIWNTYLSWKLNQHNN